MRKTILCAVLMILSMQFLHAQNNEVSKAPFGTIKISDNFYADKTETLNIHWLEFLHYQKKELDTESYFSLFPTDNSKLSIPSYTFLPLYSITYQQVIKCNYSGTKKVKII